MTDCANALEYAKITVKDGSCRIEKLLRKGGGAGGVVCVYAPLL